MSLSSEAQSLFDHAKNSLPRWLTGSANAALEWLYGYTEELDEVRIQGQDWLDSTYILLASGSEIDQHAADRGTSRRSGETDSALQTRLRSIADAVTEPAVLNGVNLIVDSTGQLAKFHVSHSTTSGWNTVLTTLATYASGTSGFYTTVQTIDDGTNPATVESVANGKGNGLGRNIIVHFKHGVTTRAQMETLLSTYFTISTVTTGPAGVLAVNDAFGPTQVELCGLVALRRDRAHMHAIGSCRAFMSRGYRMTGVGRPMGYIVILPYGTTSATAASVAEYLRQNGPAGYLYYIERRLNP